MGTNRSGRKRKPIQQTILEGNPGKRNTKALVVAAEKQNLYRIEKPSLPGEATQGARAVWDELLRDLPANDLRSIDTHQLLILSQEIWNYRYCQDRLINMERAGITDDEIALASYYRRTSKTAAELIQKLSGEFGMTPASRARLLISDTRDADPWKDFV